MENDNKKKKNKKKKNKQAKNAEPSTAAATVPESVSAHQISNGFDQNHQTNAFQPQHTQQLSPDLDTHGVTASNASTEQVKQLQMEKEEYMNKEIDLELKFSKLHNEKAILEEKIKQLQMEKEEYMKKEADLGLMISKLQTEKECWLRKETGYEEKINQLVDEASTTSSKEVVLEEKIKQLETEREFLAQEASATETIAGLNADNTRLHSQVMELEESQKNLLQENQQLLENISGLQSQMQNSANLSSEIGKMESQHIKSEMFAAQTMIEKLLLENAELTAKLNAERDQKGTKAELSSSDCSGSATSTIDPAHIVKHSALVSDSTSRTTERLLGIPVTENLALEPDRIAGTGEKLVGEVVAVASSEKQPLLEEKTMPIENEIEQIPLEENDASGTNLPVEDSSGDETSETSLVPISDAPLIGAPFRFISYMARYVSGADLVNRSA